MTEEEWLACSDPLLMLEHLCGRRGYDRKLRLFACACCRRIWDLLKDQRSLEAVEVTEQFVDGHAKRHELARAADAAHAVIVAGVRALATSVAPDSGLDFQTDAADAAWRTAAFDSIHRNVSQIAMRTSFDEGLYSVGADNKIAQVRLLRDIFGRPYPFPQLIVEKVWLNWKDSAAVKMARSIYDGRRFELLPVLCDILEDAGCGEGQIIRHCREETEHVRGCWVVDMLLENK